MEDIAARFFANLGDRVGGPMSLRLFLQPTMAFIFAARAGLRDAKSGRPPFLWAMFTSQGDRRAMLREGWTDVGKVFIMALVIDAIYQIVVARWIYPVETLVVAVILAFVPYVVFRGLFTRAGRLMGMGPVPREKPRAV